MKLTNKNNLPLPLVRAVENDEYTKGDADISVTGLLEPPLIRVLKNRYWDELEEDASDRIFSLLGQVVHKILERASEEQALAEKRFSIICEEWRISGGMDRIVVKDGLIQDYKFVTVHKVKGKDTAPEEWVRQLNIYAEILRQNKIEVRALQIVAIFRDWSKLAAKREEDYPVNQVQVIDIPLIERELVLEYIQERVRLHQQADSGDVLECTAEERWARKDTWAVVKKGAKRAHRVCESEEAAEFVVKEMGKDYSVVFREGESVRCAEYCPVSKFCTFYQNKQKEKNDY